MKFKFIRKSKNAVIPSKAHDTDVGMDLTAITNIRSLKMDYCYILHQQVGCLLHLKIKIYFTRITSYI